jgi:hypothetical protein
MSRDSQMICQQIILTIPLEKALKRVQRFKAMLLHYSHQDVRRTALGSDQIHAHGCERFDELF